MKLFMDALSTLLNRGEKILIYPEQGMWWNYKKPRPMKSGAFNFAVKNNVPVIPVFITMEDTDKLDNDGFPVQAYTMHFSPAIYPKVELSSKENVEIMKNENYRIWKEIYEDFYKIPLKYGE
jgi:1-acyl-sn-glycerol-3-phosphate acyltransferase